MRYQGCHGTVRAELGFTLLMDDDYNGFCPFRWKSFAVPCLSHIARISFMAVAPPNFGISSVIMSIWGDILFFSFFINAATWERHFAALPLGADHSKDVPGSLLLSVGGNSKGHCNILSKDSECPLLYWELHRYFFIVRFTGLGSKEPWVSWMAGEVHGAVFASCQFLTLSHNVVRPLVLILFQWNGFTQYSKRSPPSLCLENDLVFSNTSDCMLSKVFLPHRLTTLVFGKFGTQFFWKID